MNRDGTLTPLTERELQVLRLIADGKVAKEIARELCISHKTVEKHTQSAYKKFGPGPHNAVGVCVKAIRQGIIQ